MTTQKKFQSQFAVLDTVKMKCHPQFFSPNSFLYLFLCTSNWRRRVFCVAAVSNCTFSFFLFTFVRHLLTNWQKCIPSDSTHWLYWNLVQYSVIEFRKISSQNFRNQRIILPKNSMLVDLGFIAVISVICSKRYKMRLGIFGTYA